MPSPKNDPEPELVLTILDEYLAHKSRAGGLQDSFLETALYLEDAFGVVFSDDELHERTLGTADDIARLVLRKLREGR